MPSKRRPTRASLIERKRAGVWQVRKTVYFLQPTIERLERYAFHHHLSLWEVVDAAAVEYLDRVAPIQTRRRNTASTAHHSVLFEHPSTPAPSPRSKRRSSTVPSPAHESHPPPSSPPSTRKNSAPPRSRKT